ncbi:MAG: hypothetical protein JRI68_33650 [Deltaproteobacteria bacterium]|nr:hypothetical protein [Deltaproteobacteria bacterium]
MMDPYAAGQPGNQAVPMAPPVDDPISKSSAVTGAVANFLIIVPFVGGILGIIFGLVAVGKAKRGKEAVEASAGGLRGVGAHMAGKIMGWCAFGFGIFMTLYYLVVGVAVLSRF